MKRTNLSYSFSINKSKLRSLILNSDSHNYDLLIDVVHDGLYVTFGDNENFISTGINTNVFPSKYRVRTNDMLVYLQEEGLPENLDFYVKENVMICINGPANLGALLVQHAPKQFEANRITVLDNFLVDELLQICEIDLKDAYQKTLRNSGIDHVIQAAELYNLKQLLRNEVVEIVKNYATDVELLEGEYNKDIRYVLNLDEQDLEGLKMEVAEIFICYLNEHVA